MTTATLPTDPVELVRQLDTAVIRERLDALDRERAALMVLLRAAGRAAPPPTPTPRPGSTPRA